jgi:hypothetical protein
MGKNYRLRSFGLGLIVLAALLIQSAHSFHHLREDFSKEKCHHHYSENQTQLTHSHELEHCFACEFVFFKGTEHVSFSLNWLSISNDTQKPVLFLKEVPSFFKGSFFSLRGPPCSLK